MGKPWKVLLVEDEVFTAMSIKVQLEDKGLVVLDPVSRGEDSVEIALKENPDLILMDIRLMGEMDGIEAAERIWETRKIPIVFMSGYTSDFLDSRVKRVNPVAFLDKPIQRERIDRLIEGLGRNP